MYLSWDHIYEKQQEKNAWKQFLEYKEVWNTPEKAIVPCPTPQWSKGISNKMVKLTFKCQFLVFFVSLLSVLTHSFVKYNISNNYYSINRGTITFLAW